MSFRTKVLNLGQRLLTGRLAEHREGLKRAGGALACFTLGMVSASVRLFEYISPFGAAITAQAGAGAGGIATLLGASAGYLIFGGFDWGIRYVATSVLIFTIAFVFQNTRIYSSRWFMPLVSGLVCTITAALNSFSFAFGAQSVIMILCEITLASGCTYFFSVALSKEARDTDFSEIRHGVGLLILLSCIYMAFTGAEIMGVVSVGRMAAVLTVMAFSLSGGSLSGCSAGAAMGFAMDLSAGGTPYYSMAYAFAGLIAGAFSKHGKLLFVLSYVISSAAATAWTWQSSFRVEILYEAFVASVLFIMLPTSMLMSFGSALQRTPAGKGETGLRRYSAGRLRSIGAAFTDLYETVRRSLEESSNDNDIARVFDRAADGVCSACKNKNECWSINYMDTLSIMNDVTPHMLENGSLREDDLPERFREKCPSAHSFAAAVNSELRGLMYRKQYRSRLAENRTAAYGQYADMAQIMDSVADELAAAGGADPLAERRLMRFLQENDIDAEISVFRDRSGRMRAIIESGRLTPLIKDDAYLDKLSAALGVRLCKPDLSAAKSSGKLVVMEAEPLTVSVGIATIKKRGESVNGDRGTYFKTEQGVLCVILSDGMGSGEEAARESVAVVRILESFLRAGVEPNAAMKVLNSVMLLKNGDEWGFATVDLMCVDLFTGETCFYKYGAAPSYIKFGGGVRRIKGRSLAVGLASGEASAPDVVKMKLKPGSIAVIASDGVMVQDDDRWLRNLLANWKDGGSKELATETMTAAVKQYGRTDDMTVLTVFVNQRA